MGKSDYFVQSVDSVLQQHQGYVRVDEIHINYFLHKAHSHHLDAWVRCAVASKAKVLYLHLAQPYSRFRNIELYDFPLHLLPSSSIEELYLVACTLKPPYQADFLSRLRVLAMWEVGDTRDDINHLVSLCSSSLKRLEVARFNELVENLPKCSSSFIHLKHLDWEWSVGVKMSHLHLDILFEAAPFLEKLKLLLSPSGDEEPPPRLTKLKKKLPKHPHPHLKTIEISGFYFERWQVQIVLYILINVTKLESMTLILEKGPKTLKKKINETDMNRLVQQVPPNVRLEIL